MKSKPEKGQSHLYTFYNHYLLFMERFKWILSPFPTPSPSSTLFAMRLKSKHVFQIDFKTVKLNPNVSPITRTSLRITPFPLSFPNYEMKGYLFHLDSVEKTYVGYWILLKKGEGPKAIYLKMGMGNCEIVCFNQLCRDRERERESDMSGYLL